MPDITGSDLRVLYTNADGPGNTYPQAVPAASLGGFASHTPYTGGVLNDLFGALSAADADAGLSEFRCLYAVNTHPSQTAFNVTVARQSDTSGGCVTTFGVDPTAQGYLGQEEQQAVQTTSVNQAPEGVEFSISAVLGDLPPGVGRAFWVKSTPDSSRTLATDTAVFTLTFSS